MTEGLVLLSVGADDRVQPGYRFSIRRGPELVGTVVVEKVLRDASSARVLGVVEGFSIQPGDEAATRL